MKINHKLNAGMLCLLAITGCADMLAQRDNSQARERYEYESLKSDFDALKERLNIIEASQERLQAELIQIKNGQGQDQAGIQAKINELDALLRATEASRAKIRQDVVDDLSPKIAELLKNNARNPVPTPPDNRTTRMPQGNHNTAAGFHVVESGQTLTQIAKQYNVSSEELMKTNGITDPNKIRQGQKLIIP